MLDVDNEKFIILFVDNEDDDDALHNAAYVDEDNAAAALELDIY